ncbi:MAG: undecaprenyl-diphosphate phosphatase [Chlamydiota bacterium]
MSLLQAIILGVIQGLTEFLPVSSSGHLILGQIFLGLESLEKYILFDLVCHLGTLLAILSVFYKQLYHAVFIDRSRLLQICIAILPLFPLLIIMKPIKGIFDQPQFLFLFFGITALFLFLGLRFGHEKKERLLHAHRWRDPLVIGLFQAFAIFPGVSRSGSTISGARLIGWSKERALNFSFLIAIPTILGGFVLEVLKLYRSLDPNINEGIETGAYIAGFLTSFIVGYGALRLLMKLVLKDGLMVFVWYCLAVSLFCFFMFNFSFQ